MNDVISPQVNKTLQLNEDGKIIEDEKEIGNIFNSFFIEKIINLRENRPDNGDRPYRKTEEKDGEKKFNIFIKNCQ